MHKSEDARKYQVDNRQPAQGQTVGDHTTVHNHFYASGSKSMGDDTASEVVTSSQGSNKSHHPQVSRYCFYTSCTVFFTIITVIIIAVYNGLVPWLSEQLHLQTTKSSPEPSGSNIASVYNTLQVNDMAWSPKGDLLAIATGEHKVAILEHSLSTGTWPTVATYTTIDGSSLDGLAWSPDTTYLALAEGHDVHLWNWRSSTFTGTIAPSLRKAVTAVAWSPDGAYIASASNDNQHIGIQVWNALTQRAVKAYTMSVGSSQDPKLVWSLSWSPDSKNLAFTSPDNTIITWNIEKALVRSYRGHSNSIYQVMWSHNGNYILASSADKTVIVWNVANGNQQFTFKKHSNIIKAAVWSPNDNKIVSASYDGKIIIWSINNNQFTILYSSYIATTLAWSSDGTYLAFGGNATDNNRDSAVRVCKISFKNMSQ